MQKQLLLCVSALLLCLSMQAQWSLSGNNNASATTSKLGTTNSIPLRLFTNNLERMRLDAATGKVGINLTSSAARLAVKSSGSTPLNAWAGTGSPIFAGYGETSVGNADFILAMAAPASNARSVLLLRRSRGSLASPTTVANNDFLGSLLASGHDGSAFQNPAAVDFFVDGTPAAGSVPARISFVTGANTATRAERLTIKSNGFVGIGTTSPVNEMHVVGRGKFTSGLSVDNGTISVESTTGNGLYAKGTAYGVYGVSENEEDDLAGVFGRGYFGVQGQSGWIGVYANGGYYGLLASGDGTGVSAYSDGGYGVEGFSSTGVGVYGATSTSTSFAGYFAGDVYSSGIYEGSDRALKQNIGQMSGALSIIGNLKPKVYEYRQDGHYALMNLPKGKRYGLIAQDVEATLPSLVKAAVFHTARVPDVTKAKGSKPAAHQASDLVSFKTVNYTALIPVLIGAVQEQQVQVNEQKELISRQEAENKKLLERLEQLEALVKNLSNNPVAGLPSVTASLGTATPNPVNGPAIIRYYLSENTRTAYLLITDVKGKRVNQISLNNRGRNQVTLNTATMAAGTYTYSLFADGRAVDSKKLIVAR